MILMKIEKTLEGYKDVKKRVYNPDDVIKQIKSRQKIQKNSLCPR